MSKMLLETGRYIDTSEADLNSLLEQETELFIELLQHAAENEWHDITDNVPDEFGPEARKEMQRWWDDQIAEFQSGFIRDFYVERDRSQKKQMYRLRRRIVRLKEKLSQRDRELYEAKGDLAIEKGYSEYLRESNTCHSCKSLQKH